MARIALPVIGAAVGFIYGGPAGASLGWTIGAAVGGIVDPAELPDVTSEGARLDDLRVSSSAYGAFIPLNYGTNRTAGNIIWSLPLIEEKTTETSTQGGKGGPTQKTTQVSYDYYSTFALALGEGVADDVIRIWADGKLIFSVHNDATRLDTDNAPTEDIDIWNGILSGINPNQPYSADAGFRDWTLYPGDETQEPDPLIVADKGDLTPAFRGLCYIVFERLPLRQFGNRIPNITVELSMEGTLRETVAHHIEDEDTYANDNMPVDWVRSRAFLLSNATSVRWDFTSGVPVKVLESTNLMNAADEQAGIIWSLETSMAGIAPIEGNIYTIASDDSNQVDGGADVVVSINPETLKVDHWVAYPPDWTSGPDAGSSLTFNSVSIVDAAGQPAEIMIITGNRTAVSTRTMYTMGVRTTAYGAAPVPILATHYTSADLPAYANGASFDAGGIYGYVAACTVPLGGPDYTTYHLNGRQAVTFSTQGDGDTQWFIYRRDTAGFGGWELPTSEKEVEFSLNELKALFPDVTWGTTPILQSAMAMMWDYADNGLMFIIDARSGGVTERIYVKWSTVTKEWMWAVQDFHIYETGSTIYTGQQRMSIIDGATYNLDHSSGEVVIYDTITGLADTPIAITGASNGRDLFNSSIEASWATSGVSDSAQFYDLKGAVGLPVPVQTILDDLTNRVGLDDSLYLEETTEEVQGFQVTRLTNARQSMSSLALAFNFDVIESDFGFKVIARGGASGQTVDDTDLVFGNDVAAFTENRASEVDLPVGVNISFRDDSIDYQARTVYSRRAKNPTHTNFSDNSLSITIPATMSASRAQQTAEIILYSAWSERIAYSFKLPQRYLSIEPADVITLDRGGATYEQRIGEVALGANLELDMTSVATESAQYQSNAYHSPVYGFIPPSLPGSELTRYFPVRSPLLKDSHDVLRASAGLYHAAAGYGSGIWPGAILDRSVNGTVFASITNIPNEVVWGFVQDVVPTTDRPFSPDTDTTLTVSLVNGELEGISDVDLLTNSLNAAAIVLADGTCEIIQFRDVTEVSETVFEISYILRGRRGTDYQVNNHTSGEVFILLDTAAVQMTSVDLAELGVVRLYRASAYGSDPEQAEVVSVTPEGLTLMPYAPVQVEATLAATDIDLAWVRRTRINGSLRDSIGTVDLNEDSEEYEIDIYDDAAQTTLLRTITGLSSPDYTYLNADIITDFGLIPSELNVIVYQISAQVGRGFGILRTIEVM